MFKKEIEDALNEQVIKEAFASKSYLAMASWSESVGLSGSAKFFYAQSEEEQQHMLRIFHYINEAGGHALAPEIKQPQRIYESLQHAIQVSLEQEVDVTKSIHELAGLSLDVKDFGTFNFMQWFIAEQQEEEQMFNAIEAMLRLAGGKDANMFLVDKEMWQMKSRE